MIRPSSRALLARSLLVALLAVLLGPAALLRPPPAHADTSISTPWPVVEVEAGSETTLELEVAADPTQRVDLEVVEAPEGWNTLLRGGGFAVRAVTPGDGEGDETNVELEVGVPPDAEQGSHRITVAAEGEDGTSDTVDLELVVADEVAGAVTVEAEFAELTGAADETFSWSLQLDNSLPGETTFSLQAAGPAGWGVSARPSSESQATTMTVAGGDTATINVEAQPPSNVEAGEYELLVVVSGGGQRIEVPLVAVVEGVVELELTTPDERLNAEGTSGSATRVPLLLRNTGSTALEEVSLSADPPVDWEVVFEPDPLPPVAPGETVEVAALITPADDAITGDYLVGLSAEAQGRASDLELRYQVETPLGWGAVGAGLIAVALAALGYVFRRFGRR